MAVADGIGDGAGTTEGLALCLSGGGYRAMLFHLGTLWYLRDAGYLARIDRVSSVSGGSITAGVAALAWPELVAGGDADLFERRVVAPLRALAGETLDAPSILLGALGPGTIGDRIAKAYRKHLFGEATLQDLPDAPRFVINATNVQTGSLFRFSKPYVADWQVGVWPRSTLRLATAVAASSAFPPVLSPVRIEVPPNSFREEPGPLARPPYTTEIVLTDGGVYDNLGLQTAERFPQILVSDGGGRMAPEPRPHTNWAQHALRINALIDNQVRSLRKSELVGDLVARRRRGAYWGMWTQPGDYPVTSRLELPAERARELAETPTRLAKMPDELQERIVNFGYGMAERGVRSYFDPDAVAAERFPYPRGI